ncbi:hypothetical protein ABKN59_008499 [Abortiporus biennis]
MAKGKSANPADSFRKAQRKKELKKNKADRAKARDFALVKKDTRDIEEEIEKLESKEDASPTDRSRLSELKIELEKINKKKEEYVAEHPDQRKLVFRSRKQEDSRQQEKETPLRKNRNLFNKNGLPRHPERSIYYDPVMNPYGVAPPGMPYMERPLRPDEVNSDEDVDGDEDDDIAMPEGPPPEHSDDSDDDIPMPEGPPPKDGIANVGMTSPAMPPLPPGLPPPADTVVPPIPIPPPSLYFPVLPNSFIPPPPPGFTASAQPPFGFPPPPPGFASLPPPPPGFAPGGLPPPPPGFFPRKTQTSGSMQDPLSSIPHQTYQAHRAARTLAPPHPSLPPNPTLAHSSTTSSSAAVVSAEPQLRDFKKESTAFVPSTIKRKKVAANVSSMKINSAPVLSADSETNEESSKQAPRPDLLGSLKAQFGSADIHAKELAQEKRAAKPKDDYEKFMDEMGDLLGKPS